MMKLYTKDVLSHFQINRNAGFCFNIYSKKNPGEDRKRGRELEGTKER